MTDHATPNLPSRNFEATSRFYAALGFSERYRDDGWMILARGSITLELFSHPEVATGYPRLHPPLLQPWGLRMAALIDLDGTLQLLVGLALHVERHDRDGVPHARQPPLPGLHFTYADRKERTD